MRMKMVVGLGNPGKEYENTRHNIGFMVLDSFVSGFSLEKKWQAYVKRDKIQGQDVLFVKPVTFMNLSGDAVRKIADYYHVQSEDILVIQDDLDLNMGTFKIKRDSSAGGHNGIKSIIQSLNTNHFWRLKVGVSHDRSVSTVDYVLGKFSISERQQLEKLFPFFQDIIETFICKSYDQMMQIYSIKKGEL